MTCYSNEPRDQTFVKDHSFIPFPKNISKYLSGKESQKLLDHAEQSVTDALKTTLKKVIKKTPGATSDLNGNIKLLIKLQKSHKLKDRIVQRQLQMKQKTLDFIKK